MLKYIMGMSTLMLLLLATVEATEIQVLEQQITQLRQTMLNHVLKLSQQQRTLQKLQGQIEVLTYQVNTLTHKKDNKTVEPIAELPETPVSLEPPIIKPTESTTQTAGNSKEDFRHILDLLKSADYDAALKNLKIFITRYPKNNDTDDAQYLIGDVYYIKKQFDLALPAFSVLIEEYPNSPKHAQALLKIGYIYLEQKEYDTAKAILQQVTDIYPNTPIAHLAEQRLQKIPEK
ncbi:MAG: tol-pal system protein YbgF [Thiomargarita sp.]|nr:tol-pal system protein YbgF [Thiomargarita sp.]